MSPKKNIWYLYFSSFKKVHKSKTSEKDRLITNYHILHKNNISYSNSLQEKGKQKEKGQLKRWNFMIHKTKQPINM